MAKVAVNTTEAVPIKSIKRGEIVTFFKIDNEDNLFVITNLSLLKVDKGNTTAKRIGKIPQKETIIDITFDFDNTAFVKTQKGNSYKIS